MDNEIVRRVKDAIRQVEPYADIYLYGSRARRDSNRDSDWDFLVLVDGPVDTDRTDRVRHLLYEIEWDMGEIISSIVRNREEWNGTKHKETPMHENIEREGLLL